jgi:hypothetical protein
MFLAFAGELNGVRGWLPRRTTRKPDAVSSRIVTVTLSEPDSSSIPPFNWGEAPSEFRSQPRPSPAPAPNRETPSLLPAIIMSVIAGVLLLRIFVAQLLTLAFRKRSRRWSETELSDLLGRIAVLLNVRRKIALTRSAKIYVPFTFGVWRPVIVLPHLFKEAFTPAQREAALAHELAHIAGFDSAWRTFSNVLCALLWWNPFAWLAKRELDHANELVADEASLLVADGPSHLADCLVLCAKAQRPALLTAWLGMDGGRFRSALGRRVARLLQLRTRSTPRRYVPGLLRLVAPLLCIALLWLGIPLFMPEGAQRDTWNDSILGSAVAAAAAKLPESVNLNLTNAIAAEDMERVQQEPIEAPRRNFKSEVRGRHTSPERGRLEEKLRTIRLREWGPIHGFPLSEVIRDLSEQARRSDPAKQGVNFILDAGIQDISALEQHLREQRRRLELGSIMPLEVKLAEAELTRAREQGVTIRLGSKLTGLTLEQVLNVLTTVADRKIKYAVEDYGVVLSVKEEEPAPLHTRFFRVSTPKLREKLGLKPGDPNESMIPAFKNLMSGAGVDLSASGKAVFWSDTKEVVMVRATLEELDVIERMLAAKAVPPKAFTNSSEAIRIQVARLVQDGKVLLEAGRLDDAQTMLRSALQLDAINKPAAYYLDLIAARRNLSILPLRPTAENTLSMGITNAAHASEQQRTNSEKKNVHLLAIDPAQVVIQARATDLAVTDAQRIARQSGISSMTWSATATETFTNGPEPAVRGILTDEQYRRILQSSDFMFGANLLSAPDVTTLSGGQAQIKLVNLQYVLTGYETNGINVFKEIPEGAKKAVLAAKNAGDPNLVVEQFDIGPKLDVVPYVEADGYTVRMTVVSSLRVFMGPDRAQPALWTGGVLATPPKFRLRQATATATVKDGQTLVLGVGTDRDLLQHRSANGNRTSSRVDMATFFFITPRLIDPAGNRLHSEEELKRLERADQKKAEDQPTLLNSGERTVAPSGR